MKMSKNVNNDVSKNPPIDQSIVTMLVTVMTISVKVTVEFTEVFIIPTKRHCIVQKR